jgi:hypothetical protein
MADFIDLDHSNQPSLKLDAEAVGLAMSPLARMIGKPRMDCRSIGRKGRHAQHSHHFPIRQDFECAIGVRDARGAENEAIRRD